MSTIDKINYYLSKCGKNGAGLCEYLGVSSGVYSQWNTGRTSPRKSKLPMIAEYLGVSVSDLLPDASEQVQEQQGIKKTPGFSTEGWTDLQKEGVEFLLSLSPEKLALFLKMGRAGFENDEND